MLYIKDGAIQTDSWSKIADDTDIPATGSVIIPAARFLAAHESTTEKRTDPLGIIWPNHEPVTVLQPYIERLALIALVFPSFRDGRAYSQARLIRERLGFEGELRATGDVLRDQFLFMARSGFNAYEVKKDADAQAFTQALDEFSVLYQPATQVRSPFRGQIAPHRPGNQNETSVYSTKS